MLNICLSALLMNLVCCVGLDDSDVDNPFDGPLPRNFAAAKLCLIITHLSHLRYILLLFL